jgi:gamma-glutamyltranspeptidase/glutathione hydrolase
VTAGAAPADGGRRLTGGAKVLPPPESLRPTIVGTRYVVSAGHHLAAAAAARVLDRGGNAIDAGVAAGLASNVVLPDMCNFGGVAPILLRPAGGDEVWSVAGLGTWGAGATLEAFRARYGDRLPQGPGNVVVPGAPDAWLTALERFGTWSFAEVAEPAIELAEDGFALDPRAAFSISLHAADWDTNREAFFPGGREPRPGDVLRQPDLAALLRRLAAAGDGADRRDGIAAARSAFYEGEVAARIVDFNGAGGGWLTLADLAAFRAEVAPAVSRRYAGWLVHTPGPWCQGPALLQALAILDGFDLPALGHNTAGYLHVLAESVKLAFSDRERYYGDPRHVDVPLEELLTDEHAAELRARIAPATALPNLPTLREPHLRRSDTTYLCVVDRDGNAFSATPSDTLDEGPIVPGLGIVVSPRGVQSRLDPAHPSVLAPGKRPRLTPSPALALGPGEGADRRVWAFGSPGGDVILQAMLQAFLNVVEFGMTPQQAVEAPRVASFSFPNSFYPHIEPHGLLKVEGRIAEDVRNDLAGRGHDVAIWPDWEFEAGSVSLALDLEVPGAAGRVLAAAADPRRSAYAIGR